MARPSCYLFFCIFFMIFSIYSAPLCDWKNKRRSLSGCDFHDQNLLKADFSGRFLENVNFKRANLTEASFNNSRIVNCHFEDAVLERAHFEKAFIESSEFLWSNLFKANFTMATFSFNVHLLNAYLKQAVFNQATFNSISFNDANLISSQFVGAIFKRVSFRNADLSFVNFSKATFKKADFYGADLENSTFEGSSFEESLLGPGPFIDKTATIIHLGQTHWRDELTDRPELIEEVAHSQLRVAKQILFYKGSEVFLEGLENDLYKDKGDLQKKLQKLFPQGLNVSFKSLNSRQKKYLAEYGAVLILYSLGKIEKVHRSWTADEDRFFEEKIDAQFKKGNKDIYSPEIEPICFDRRERALVREVRSFLKNPSHKNKTVLIVFGSLHSFEKYFKHFNFFKINLSV